MALQRRHLLALSALSPLATLPALAQDKYPSRPLRIIVPLPVSGAADVSVRLLADAMQPACGTLDCHGQVGRNMRLYGGRGLRLDPAANPADGETTIAEYNATYLSVVGLEPEALAAVLADGGRRPERLTLIRKGRGTEKHKGGQQMIAGDPLDACITSWLRGAIDQAACKLVSDATRPGGP